jgi:hypothetical protein
LGQDSKFRLCPVGPDIVWSDWTLSGQGFLGRILNLGAHWRDGRHCPTRVVGFGRVEKDLAWLFSLHPHAHLNSMVFLYSRNIKENFIETLLNSFKDPSFELTQIWGSLFPFLLFDCLNFYLLLIEMIRFLFRLFLIIEIK